ncbi:MAG: oligoendopeptidase F, partial [Clostridia bacterium]|nr:oligoendopeptidase F [Clostridia bacterium]
MAQKLLKRSEVPVQDTWRLEDIFPDNQAWEEGFKNVSALASKISAYQGKLGQKESLLEALELSTQAERLTSSLYTYARMRRDEDNANTLYQGMVERISRASAELGSKTAFLSPELLSYDESYLKELIADERFADYDMDLSELLRSRPHTLSGSEEALLALSREVSNAPGTVYDMLTDADMRFPEIEDEKGEKVRLTQSNYIPMVMSRSRDVRKAAFDALYNTYKSFSASIPAMYSGNVKSDIFYAKARKHTNSLSASLFHDNMPVSVYESLITAVNEHLGALNKFVSINA